MQGILCCGDNFFMTLPAGSLRVIRGRVGIQTRMSGLLVIGICIAAMTVCTGYFAMLGIEKCF